jgi:DNA modification methylase
VSNPADKVEQRSVASLIPYARNARTHSDEQVAQIAASIKEWGWTIPVLVDETGQIIAGHGRVAAARLLDMDEVPVMVASGWTDAQKRAYVLADNKLAMNAGWDDELLALELKDLREVGVDLSMIGFGDAELDALFADLEVTEGLSDEDEIPEVPIFPVTVRGDLWILGAHRLMCGDSTSIDDVDKLMNGEQADLAWTDPPYNIAVEGAAGKIMNDDMGDAEFVDFLSGVYVCFYAALKAGACIYVAHSESERINFTQTFKNAGFKLSQVLIWVKQSATLSRQDFNWQHEPILYGWKEGAGHYFCGDFTRTTVIEDDINFKKMDKKDLISIIEEYRAGDPSTIVKYNRPSRSELHPTMKPVGLVQRMIRWSSKREQLVLDLFGGSGSTMIACEQSSRKNNSMELDPKYCDVIIARWEKFTGKQATLESSDQTFKEIKDGRINAQTNSA